MTVEYYCSPHCDVAGALISCNLVLTTPGTEGSHLLLLAKCPMLTKRILNLTNRELFRGLLLADVDFERCE